jgi:putative peptidoglycan lipid II flippase
LSEESPGTSRQRSTARSALAIGSGIFLSRITGFIRDLTIAFFFGTTLPADAYAAALRIPNILRNLLGEGTLSAAFVPVYSAMLGRDRSDEGDAGEEEEKRLARGILGFVLLLAGLLSALGIVLAPLLTRIVAPGFEEEGRELTTALVRILFPMAGVMIVAAWCLGVLNSHRRFFLPFVAPVLWNLAQVGGLLLGARLGWEPLIHVLAWSTLIGSVLQLGIQLPVARRLAGGLRPAIDLAWEPVRRVVRNAGPVAASQGIFQFSSFIDVVLASTLAEGAIIGLYYAQRMAYLPLALFGVSVATASLPEMSRDTQAEALRHRLLDGFFKILFFVLPSAVVLIMFGDLIVAVLFQRGRFGADSAALVTWILSAYAVGIVASSSVKLFASGLHAMQDTVTPMRIAGVAVAVGVAVGAGTMLAMNRAGFGAASAAGLALGGAVGAWLNLTLLGRALSKRVGRLFGAAELKNVARLVVATAAAAAAGWGMRSWLATAVGSDGTLAAAALLTGSLAVAAVPYLVIARRPPSTGPAPGSG